MNVFRITKYNPQFRTDDMYIKDEWTSFSDVGKSFEGHVLTLQEYLQVEKAYVDFYCRMLERWSISHMEIQELEYDQNLCWKNGQRIDRDQISSFIVKCLREQCWGKLISPILQIHFGYDYYTYLVASFDLTNVAKTASKFNLYAELINS